MSTAAGRVLTGILIHKTTSTVRLNSVRPLALSCLRSAGSKPTDEVNKPIKFSSSKASHRTWRVERSMGSHFQQPRWKVLPISLFAVAFLLWCALREPTDIDRQLDAHLSKHFPTFLPNEEEAQSSNEEEAQTQNKSD